MFIQDGTRHHFSFSKGEGGEGKTWVEIFSSWKGTTLAGGNFLTKAKEKKKKSPYINKE